MENQRFEESFKNAFEGAEATPSEKVWTNVELALEKASGGKMKRRLLMFQLLAAASTVFALGIGGVYYLNSTKPVSTEQEKSIAQVELNDTESSVRVAPDTNTNDLQVNEAPLQASTNMAVQQVPAGATTNKQKGTVTEPNRINTVTVQKRISANNSNSLTEEDIAPVQIAARTNVVRVSSTNYRLPVQKPMLVLLPEPENQPDAGMLLLAQLQDVEKKYQQEDKKHNVNEKLWTALGMSAGAYDPNMSSAVSTLSVNGRSAVSDASVGTTYAIGLSMGTRLSKRFVLQGGVSYLTQNADFTSATTTSHGFAALNEYANSFKLDAQTMVAAPYRVNSSLQFISVPIQAGYVLVDQNFGIQLNGGVATDLFLQNTLTPEDDHYQKVTQSAGSDSPYRTVNFSGLLGTEFSYKVARQYRVALVPGIRYSLNSLYKDDVGTKINPVAYDVSLRFRYIFD